MAVEVRAVKAFKEIWQKVYYDFLLNGTCKFHHFFIHGGRECSKTFTSEQILISGFLSVDGLCCQIVRQTEKMVKKQKYGEIISMLNLFDVPKDDYSYKAGEMTFVNKLNNNLIILDSLNEEDNPAIDGGKIDLPIQPRYVKKFINFYEEANQMNPILIDQHQISTRSADSNYQKLNIYAWNPYRGNDWCTKIAETLLPPNLHELETVGFQYGEFPNYKNGSGAIVLRINYRKNPFISADAKQLIESIKEIDYERYKVVGLGMSGNIFNSIYQHNLLKARDVDVNAWTKGGVLLGGVDPGWTESNTACILINARKYNGVDILDEFGIMNKSNVTPQDYVNQTVTTKEQIDKVIEWYKSNYLRYKKSILVYVDNAAYPDFYQHFNNRLAHHGLNKSQVEFVPAKKTGPKYSIGFRIDTLRYMLSSQLLGINKNTTPYIYQDIYNCYYEEVKTMHEDTKQKRSHEWTHFLNALEYALCERWHYYRELNPLFFEKN